MAEPAPARYLNPRSGATWPVDVALSVAPDDGGFLDLSPGDGLAPDMIRPQAPGLWRYGAAIRLPRPDADVVSLGEGWTPLLPRRWRGTPIAVKCEHMMPTGSFKDRGVSVLLNYLAQTGIGTFLEDTSGNTGSSMASYAAALGLNARIVMPDTAPVAKRIHPRFMGAEVIEVSGGREAAAERVELERRSTFYAGHNWQPFFIEGTKTLAFELWEQRAFAVPDVVVMPVGQGSNLMGCHIGFGELLRRGAIERMPRLFGIQAANCAPYAAAFASAGQRVPEGFAARGTIADGIASERPVRLPNVLAAAHVTGGAIAAVEEDEIVAAWRDAATLGLFVEPTGAVALAGVTRLVALGMIAAGEDIVVVTTGTGLKAIEKASAELGRN
jgi:threonine synthase